MPDPLLDADAELKKRADPVTQSSDPSVQRPAVSVPPPAQNTSRPSTSPPAPATHRPGHEMRQRAINAPVQSSFGQGLQSAQHGAREFSEGLDSDLGKIGITVANAFSPIDVGETAKLGSNAVQIASMVNARQDPLRQAAHKDALARNAAAMDQKSLDVQANKLAHDEAGRAAADQARNEYTDAAQAKMQEFQQKVKQAEDAGTPLTVDEKRKLASETHLAPTQEAAESARTHMLISRLQRGRRKAKAAGASDEQVAKMGTGSTVMGSAFKAVAANLRLGATSAGVGADFGEEWEMKHTVGEEVSGDLAQHGHVMSEADRPESTYKGAFNRTVRSIANKLPGLDSDGRPLGNYTKLSDKEKGLADDLSEKISDLNKRGEQSIKDRKDMEKGYTPEEHTRRAELKSQIAGLTAKGKAAREASGGKFSDTDQVKYDQLAGGIDGYKALTKARQDDAVAAHQSEIDKLDAAAKASLDAREKKGLFGSGLFGSKSGSKHHFTADEKTKQLELESKIKAIKDGAKGRDLTDDEKSQISGHEATMDDMKAYRDTGYTREQREQKAKLESSIAGIRADDAYGMTEDEHKDLARNRGLMKDMEQTRDTGLSKEDRAALSAAHAERDEQKLTRKTGLTTTERQIKQHLEDSRTRVYEGATAEKDLVARNAGKTVRKLGDKHFVGGLNSSDNVSEEEMESTIGGRAAQGARTFGDAMKFGGEVMQGSADKAQEYIDNNELAKATAITTGGAIKQGLSTTGSVLVPGFGGVGVKAVMEGGGAVVEGAGSMVSSIASSAAEAQDQRDRQAALTKGDRQEEIRHKAMAWTGNQAPEDKGLGSKLLDSVSTMASGATSILGDSDLGKGLKSDAMNGIADMLPEQVAEHVRPEAEADGPKELTLNNVKDETQKAVTDHVKGTVQDQVVAGGSSLVSSLLDGHKESAPKEKDLRRFNREYARKKKAQADREAGLARQEGVRQQRAQARANAGGDVDGVALHKMFNQHEIQQQRVRARADTDANRGPDADSMHAMFGGPEVAPAPAPVAKPEKLPWWKRLWNSAKRGARAVKRGISSVGKWFGSLFGG